MKELKELYLEVENYIKNVDFSKLWKDFNTLKSVCQRNYTT